MERKILIGFVLTLTIVIFVPVYWATESARQEAARQRQKAESAERGAHLYPLHCGKCHGRAGEGRTGPALKGSPLDEGALWRVIARGVPGKRMPAFGEDYDGALKKHEVTDLVVFIQNWDDSLVASSSHEAQTSEEEPTSTHADVGRSTGTSSATLLGKIEFDPNTPEKTLRAGEQIFRRSCSSADCHELPSAEEIRAFESDEELLETLTQMAEEAELPALSAEQVIRYLLSVRRGVAPPPSGEE